MCPYTNFWIRQTHEEALFVELWIFQNLKSETRDEEENVGRTLPPYY